MKTLILPLLALALMAGTGTAMANNATHHMKGHHHPPCAMKNCNRHEGRGDMFFKRFDLNHDGKVSKAEFHKASDAMFARMDANKDGAITRAELHKNREMHMHKMHRGWKGRHMHGPHSGLHARGGEGLDRGHQLDYSHSNDDNGQ